MPNRDTTNTDSRRQQKADKNELINQTAEKLKLMQENQTNSDELQETSAHLFDLIKKDALGIVRKNLVAFKQPTNNYRNEHLTYIFFEMRKLVKNFDKNTANFLNYFNPSFKLNFRDKIKKEIKKNTLIRESEVGILWDTFNRGVHGEQTIISKRIEKEADEIALEFGLNIDKKTELPCKIQYCYIKYLFITKKFFKSGSSSYAGMSVYKKRALLLGQKDIACVPPQPK